MTFKLSGGARGMHWNRVGGLLFLKKGENKLCNPYFRRKFG